MRINLRVAAQPGVCENLVLTPMRYFRLQRSIWKLGTSDGLCHAHSATIWWPTHTHTHTHTRYARFMSAHFALEMTVHLTIRRRIYDWFLIKSKTPNYNDRFLLTRDLGFCVPNLLCVGLCSLPNDCFLLTSLSYTLCIYSGTYTECTLPNNTVFDVL